MIHVLNSAGHFRLVMYAKFIELFKNKSKNFKSVLLYTSFLERQNALCIVEVLYSDEQGIKRQDFLAHTFKKIRV